MQFNLTTIIAISIFILLLLPAIWGFFKIFSIWRKPKSYRREEFAFAALSGLMGVFGIVTTSIFIGPTIRQILLSFFAQEYGLNYTFKETTLFEYGFFILLFVIIIYFINRLYDNWPGAITIEQYKRAQRQEPSNFVIDGVTEARRIVKRLPVPEIYNPDDTSGIDSVLEGSKDTLIWHEQALDLIMLGSKSYSFDRDDGWHDQQKCWIGRQKKTGDTVVLGCWTEPPIEQQLQTLVDYARRQTKPAKNNQLEMIVAIRQGANVETRKINGVQVKFENEAHLLDNLVDFSDYRTDIKDKVEKTPLTDSELTINDIYVPSAIMIEGDSKTQHQNIEDYLQTWLKDSSQKQIALLGEYGQGKSTGSLLFTYHLLTQAQPTRIPILIELRGKSPRNMTLEEILAAWAVPYGIDPRALMKLLIAGRLLLILEGFDEMALIGDAETRLNHFRTLWQFCYPKSKIIITGRPNFFLDDNEMKAALGIHEPTLERPYCQALHLSPFAVDKIEESLRAVNKQTRQEIVKLAKEDDKFKEIVSRPSLLYIVATLWQRKQLSQYKGRMNSALVMGMFIKQSLARQTAKVQDHRDFMVLNSSEREYFMLGIAAYMAVNKLPNQITKQQLHEAVRLLLKVIPDSASTVDTMSKEKSIPLRQRLPKDDAEKAFEYVKTDVRSCGLLVSDLSKSGAFKFAHKSFMEYLFANLVHSRLSKDKLQEKDMEITESIWNALKIEVPSILRYKESVSFMAELLYSDFSEGKNSYFVKEVFNLIVLGNQNKSWKIYIMNKLLSIYISIINKLRTSRKLHIFSFAMMSLFSFIVFIDFFFFQEKIMSTLQLQSAEENRFSIFFSVIFSVIFYVITFYFVFKYVNVSKKFKLWYQCCQVLNIDREEIAKVVGKWAMPAFEEKFEQD